MKSGPASNKEIGQLAGLSKSTVSRNNKFLLSIGLIEGGQKKEATTLGKNLGRALQHGEEGDIQKYLQKAVTGSQFLSEQLTAVRVQKGVPVDDLPGKILYNSGATKNSYTETGSRAVVDLLVRAGLLEVVEGSYQVVREPEAEPPETPPENGGEPPVGGEQPDAGRTPAAPPRNLPFQVAVNLQLQLPEFDDAKKYEELFKALRKQLLEPDSDDQE